VTQADRDRGLAWALLAIAATTVALFWPMVWGALTGDPHFFEWDVPDQYWGDLVYLCGSLHEGELPYWNPYDRGGYPFYADPQAGLYHPMNWLICGVAGESPGLSWAHLRVVSGFAVAGIFGLLWLRRRGASWAGATVGAVLLQVAPFMRHSWELNLSTALGWLPAMLWAAERALQLRRPVDGGVFALMLGGCAWIGSPPALWFASSFTAMYLAVRAFEVVREDRTAWRPLLVTGVVAGVLAVLFVGAVFVPGLELARWSVQQGKDYAAIADKALAVDHLDAILAPRPGNHLYVGWLALALAGIGLTRKQPARWGLLAIALLSIGMALGDAGPFFRLAFDWVPGVSLFRAPIRYEAWLGPAVAALAAGALGRSTSPGGSLAADESPATLASTTSWRRYVPYGLALLGGVLFAVEIPLGEERVLGFGPGALFCGAALLLGTQRWGDPRLGLALVALLYVDATQSMPEHRHMRTGPPPGRDELAERVLPHAPGTHHEWRYMDEFGVHCRAGSRFRRRDLRGYQDPLLLAAYERVVGSLREHPELAPQFNVRYALQGPHFIHGWNRHYLPPPEELREMEGAEPKPERVTELTTALPFAYWVPPSAIEQAEDRSAALERVRAFAPAAMAILDDARTPEDAPAVGRISTRGAPAAVVAATDVHVAPDVVRFRIGAREAGLVVINEAFYPGWIAEVDGERAPVHRVNAFVRGVEVAPGAHDVEMRFEPPDGAPWRGALLLGWVLLLGLGAHARRRGSRRRVKSE